jgi:hypothetical protein
MRLLLRAALLRLGRWAVLRRGRRAAALPSQPQPRRLRLSTAPPGVGFYSIGADGRTVVLSREPPARAPRGWRILRSSAGGAVTVAVLEKTHLSDRVVPSDFGLSCAVVADANGVKHFYGADDSLDDLLRQ